MLVRRGEIWYADLGQGVGSEQGGYRPVLITQNDIGNAHSPTVIVAAITSKTKTKSNIPTHYYLSSASSGLPEDSLVMMEQVRTIDKQRLHRRVSQIDIDNLSGLNGTIAVSFGLISVASLKQKKSVSFA